MALNEGGKDYYSLRGGISEGPYYAVQPAKTDAENGTARIEVKHKCGHSMNIKVKQAVADDPSIVAAIRKDKLAETCGSCQHSESAKRKKAQRRKWNGL